MGTFDVTSPDGKKYRVTAPAGASQEQVMDYVKKYHVNQSNVTEGVGRSFAEGVPILGAVVNKMDAATNAALAPLVDPLLPDSFKKLPEKSFGERYQHALDIQEQKDKTFREEHPALEVGSELAGGAASFGGAAMKIPKLLGVAGTLPQMMATGAVSGAAINAADAELRGDNPLVGAGLGAGAGLAAPVAGSLVSLLARPVTTAIRGVANPVKEATRRIAGAIGVDTKAGTEGLPEKEWLRTMRRRPAARRQPVSLMELGGEKTRALARSAANTSPEGRAIMDQEINARFESQAERLTNWLRTTFNYPDALAQGEAIDRLSSTVNKFRYDAADKAAVDRFPAGIWSPELERLTSSPDVVDAMKQSATRGQGRAVAEGVSNFQPNVTFENGALQFKKTKTGLAYPSLKFWDYTYRNLRDAADSAFRGGSNSEGMALKQQAVLLRSELDRMVPEFGEARAGAAKFFDAENSLEAGQKAVTARLTNREMKSALDKMSEDEQKLFKDGFVDRYIQMVRETPDRRSVINNIVNSPAARERLTMALGKKDARQLEAFLRVEGIMDLARGAVQGNSTTARQLTELGLAGGVDYYEGGGKFTTDPEALMKAAIIYGAARGQRSIDEKVAQQVARLLVSNDTNALKKGMELIAGNGQLFTAIRNADAALAAIFARGALPAINQKFPQITAEPTPKSAGLMPSHDVVDLSTVGPPSLPTLVQKQSPLGQ